MTPDPKLVEAVARALAENRFIPGVYDRHDCDKELFRQRARVALTAAIPLIRAAALEEAAKVIEEWIGHYSEPTIPKHYASLVRSLIPAPSQMRIRAAQEGGGGMSEYTYIINDGDVMDCESCSYLAPLRTFRGYPGKPDKQICKVCAETFIGKRLESDRLDPQRELFRVIAQVTNLILDEITGRKPEPRPEQAQEPARVDDLQTITTSGYERALDIAIHILATIGQMHSIDDQADRCMQAAQDGYARLTGIRAALRNSASGPRKRRPTRTSEAVVPDQDAYTEPRSPYTQIMP